MRDRQLQWSSIVTDGVLMGVVNVTIARPEMQGKALI